LGIFIVDSEKLLRFLNLDNMRSSMLLLQISREKQSPYTLFIPIALFIIQHRSIQEARSAKFIRRQGISETGSGSLT
jgi:hypothetical protein